MWFEDELNFDSSQKRTPVRWIFRDGADDLKVELTSVRIDIDGSVVLNAAQARKMAQILTSMADQLDEAGSFSALRGCLKSSS